MTTLVIKTDQPEAELWVYEGHQLLKHLKWMAHLKLAETLNIKIDKILNQSNKSLGDLNGIVCFRGPGSFTGLRIGLSVANAMAYAYQIPIFATTGKNWLTNGINKINLGQTGKLALPKYGRPAHITKPEK